MKNKCRAVNQYTVKWYTSQQDEKWGSHPVQGGAVLLS